MPFNSKNVRWHQHALILAILVLFSSAGWAAKSLPAPIPSPVVPVSPAYFFSIDLDPRYQIIGTGALTEEAAATSNCYRFIYAADGRVRQIEYRRAGAPTPDPFFGVIRIDFERQDRTERRWYRDAQSQPSANGYGVVGEELALNPAGYPTDITNLDAAGTRTRDNNSVIHYARTLDAQDRVVVARRIGLLGTAITDRDGFFETHTVYDAQGRSIERSNHDASGNLLDNSYGVAVVRTTYTLYPDSTQIIESYFEASGPAVEEKESGAHEVERTLDRRGLLLSEAYFDTTGAPCLDNEGQVHERRYTYDDRGNERSEEFFGVDGKPKDQVSPDYARIAYDYDALNRVHVISYFGDDGTPQIVPRLNAAIVRQDYDAQGHISRQQFFDGLGAPSPCKLYLAPAIRISVEGETTTIDLRDENDQPMANPISGYYSVSFNTPEYHPKALTNHYFDRYHRSMSLLRVRIINPHLHALATKPTMQISARYGAAAAGLGALLGALLALTKSSHMRRRKVYVPAPLERFLGWLSVLAIFEGTLRFFMTIYWAWVGYQDGKMGYGVYVLETFFILFFLYRLFRMTVTMRVLNIQRDDIHRLVRAFFARTGLNPEWDDARNRYVTPPLDVRINFFNQKYHAYLAFERRGAAGRDLARGLAEYLRAHVAEIEAPLRTRTIKLYYQSVALCYFLLAGTAFYTLWQLVKQY